MDALARMLRSQRADGAFVIRSDLCAPWSVRIEDEAPLTVVVLLRGSAVLAVDGELPATLRRGDAALVPASPTGYTVADDPSTPPQARIGPGEVCTKPDGSPLSEFRHLGVLAWGNVADGEQPETVMLTGTYEGDDQVCHHVLEHLPASVVVRADDAPDRLSSLVALLAEEVETADAAQDVVLDRLVDLLAVGLLRHWFADPAHQPRWYAAYDDPVVGGALRRMHHEPGRPWTLASLSADVGVSRATLARQFGAQVHEPPMAYLARWRLGLAADLLATTDLGLEAIAARVGYASAFSLSGAFSRRYGRSPSSYRREARSAQTATMVPRQPGLPQRHAYSARTSVSAGSSTTSA